MNKRTFKYLASLIAVVAIIASITGIIHYAVLYKAQVIVLV